MDGASALTPSDWQLLAKVLPGGGGEAAVQAREKIFKELVVRAAALPHNRFKAKTSGFKGTWAIADVQEPLTVILGKRGLPQRCIDLVLGVHMQAFDAARKWVSSISVIDRDCIDMNQFHAFVIYTSCYLSLSNFMIKRASSGAVDARTFQDLMAASEDTKLGLSDVPSGWKEEPRAAFSALAENQSVLPFHVLVDRCSFHAVQAIVVSDEFSQACRKRAFQLLQALNNMPSLPNMVPGPLSANDSVESRRNSTSSARENLRTPRTSQWKTANSEGLPLFSARKPQAAYEPAMLGTARDFEWRVFPMEVPKLTAGKAIYGGSAKKQV